jgi:hypothetical protein
MSLAWNDYNTTAKKQGINRPPCKTLKELSLSYDVSYQTIRRRFKKSGGVVDTGFKSKGNTYYNAFQLEEWANENLVEGE